MVRDDDPAVMLARCREFSGKPDKVFHVEGQNRASLSRGKRQLIAIGTAKIIGSVRREAVPVSVLENLRKQRVNIFIEVESDCH